MSDSFHYRLCGVEVDSALELPGLTPGRADLESEVVIALDRLPASLPDAAAVAPLFQLAPLALQLAIPEVATYRVERGRRITIDPAPGADPRDIRLFLLGSAFGALWLQRGLLPLHASSVAIGDACVAFAGPSGVGKSTLAGFMAGRGHALVGDDVCVIDGSTGASARVWPGPPRLKLWRDALSGLAMDVAAGVPVRSELEKYEMPPPSGVADGPLPLRAVYIMERPGVVGGSERLRGVSAIDAIAGATYRTEYAAGMGVQESHFRACAAIVARTPVIRVGRPWDFAGLREFAEVVESGAE